MGPVKLIERAASTALHTVRHPVSSAAYAAGLARGLAGAVLHGATVSGHDDQAGPRPVPSPVASPVPGQREDGSSATRTSGPPKPQRVVKPVPEPGDLPEPIVIEATDEEPGESFATEPKAVSRESAHGGGDFEDAAIDDWEEEAQVGLDAGPEVDVETPDGTPGVLDPSVAKAVRSESEILRKAAETDPDD